MKDPRRRFAGGERIALYLAADGRCSRCGSDLEPGWHADHMKPHSLGGPTDVINGQALCPTCNLKKGGRVDGLRKWQSDALREFMLWQPEGDLGFLVEATPGAGKTRLAIEVASRLIAAGRIEQVVIAVPTSHLETQWHDAFAARGMSIDPKWHASVGALAADELGCVATYPEIARQPESFRRLVGRKSTLAILDEVHHCGDSRAWGDGARRAFGAAVRKLLLSGTPFRSDNNEIPFVRYVDGTGAPDYRYGYDRGLADRVVRSVFFPRRGGSMEWEWQGDAKRATFDDALQDREANRRLRTALATGGQWLSSVLADADRQLADLRESDPRAGGIVFCEVSDDAREVAKLLQAMGREPILAITDEPASDDRITAFTKSRDPWIVSIRKVSEGVDIPRLRVGVYATPWLTEMFFRQVVGRLVRTNETEDDPTSYLFIPDDERLRAMAESIRVQRDHVLDTQVAEQLDLFDDAAAAGLETGIPGSTFTPISAVATDHGVIDTDGQTIRPEEMARAEKVKLLEPETAGLSTVLVAKLLRNAGAVVNSSPPAQRDHIPAGQVPDQSQRKSELSKANNSMVARIAKQYGLTNYGLINGALSNLVGLPSAKALGQATVAQLELRLKLASEWLRTGQQPTTTRASNGT